MADIELVIKIPERIHYGIEVGIAVNGSKASQILMDAVKNGTPLPKGHKRLIEDSFEVGPVLNEEGYRIGYKYVTQEDLNNAQTIIEADKTE